MTGRQRLPAVSR